MSAGYWMPSVNRWRAESWSSIAQRELRHTRHGFSSYLPQIPAPAEKPPAKAWTARARP